MRFCPKCGYEDPVCWHSYRWITDMDYTRWEDFCKEYPQWANINCGQIVSDLHSFYRRSSKKNNGLYVFRYPTAYGERYYLSRDFERFKAKRDFPHPSQKQLELEHKP